MKLYDPDRPLINGRPCFLSGKAVIPYPEFYPQLDGGIRVRCMLPVKGEDASKWFSGELELGDIVSFLHHMILDPEQIFDELFDDSTADLRPDLYAPDSELKQTPSIKDAVESKPRRARLDDEPPIQKTLIGEVPQKRKRVRL